MHFAIRFLTEYRYDGPVTDNLNALRVRPGDHLDAALRRVPHPHRARGARQPPPGLLRHRGDRVRDPDEPRAAHDRRPRASGHLGSARAARRERGTASPAPPMWTPPASSRCRGRISRRSRASRTCTREVESGTPLETLLTLCEVVPDRFEYRPGATYVGSTVADLLETRAGVCQDFVHLSLVLLRRHGIAARYVSGYLWAAPEGRGHRLRGGRNARLARGAPSRHRRPRRARVGQRRPDQPPPDRGNPREDRARALLLRRAPGEGPVHGRRLVGSPRRRDDVAPGSSGERESLSACGKSPGRPGIYRLTSSVAANSPRDCPRLQDVQSPAAGDLQ